MKYFILALVLLAGCSTVKVDQNLKDYKCASFNLHGVYAHYTVEASSEEEATKEAMVVNNWLIKKALVPENTGAMCAEDEK